MNIGLYGILGTYNFGCEAIVRGAKKFIDDLYPGADVFYFSYSYEYDRKALSDLDVTVVPVIETNSLTKKCINKCLRVLHSTKRIPVIDEKNMLKSIDLILSIGGDIYTIPEVLRRNKRYEYYNSLVEFCERSNLPVIVYGASVGPWGDYCKAIDYYRNHMMKYNLILCREKESVNYLAELGFNNVLFFPDPAFQLGEGVNYKGEYIGINLSPLSLKEIYGSYGEKQIQRFAHLLDSIYEMFLRPLMFVPHVLSKNEMDNDLEFMEIIRNHMKYKNKVTLAETQNGFLGVKEGIRNCCMVISARMHCAINALEENIPTIFLSYSQKSIGMCEYVYESKKWLVNIKNIEDELPGLIREMIASREELSVLLSEQNQRIKEDYKTNITIVKNRTNAIKL